MGWKSLAAVACLGVALHCGIAAQAQCSANNYVHDGAPASQRDCQPLATLQMLPAAQMSPADTDLVTSRRSDVQQALRFYGADPDAPGWEYQQVLSPLLHKHVLLIYTNAATLKKASRLVVIVPAAVDEKVQVVPSFQKGINPYMPGWNSRGSFAVYNRLLASELGGRQPVTIRTPWLQYALLYLTIAGREPLVPTQTDSIQANWNLTMKSASTPVIFEAINGDALITVSDTSSEKKSITWTLTFDKTGRMVKVEKTQAAPQKIRTFQTIDQTNYQLAREAEQREVHPQ